MNNVSSQSQASGNKKKGRKKKPAWAKLMKADLMIWKEDASEENTLDETKKLISPINPHSKVGTIKESKNNTESIIPPDVIKKYVRGPSIHPSAKIGDRFQKQKILRKESYIKFAEEQAARTELLHSEEKGFVEAERGELTSRFSQEQIKKNVDITSAAKQFGLDLPYGPYRIDYTRNGRFLLIGGKKGHLAVFDWITKWLQCEINVMESVFDVQWLHRETMFATAQKEYAYVYDNQGVELHCLKNIIRPLRLTFLPYHFLLAASTEQGNLHWLDVSTGASIHKTRTEFKERLSTLCQNPSNALLVTGNGFGVVKMWSPNSNKPIVKQLCHKSNITSVAIDPAGNYMATSSLLNDIRIWDLRNLGQMLHDYNLTGCTASDLAYSQSGLLAASMTNIVEVYKDTHSFRYKECYLRHKVKRSIFNIEFCPYEDFLGLGTTDGFTSMLVPGSGEVKFDAFEVNPVASKKQLQEMEVKSLLEKIQPEMITLNPTKLLNVLKPGQRDRMIAKRNIVLGKAPEVKYVPKNKKRRKVAASKIKEIIKEKKKMEYYNEIKGAKEQILTESGITTKTKKPLKPKALDRFKQKKINKK